MKETGLKDRETISRAFSQLQLHGLIKTWWTCGDRGFVRHYHVADSRRKARENTVGYLSRKRRRAGGGYRTGNDRQKGAGKTRQQGSSIHCTSKKQIPNTLQDTIIDILKKAPKNL